MIYPNPLKIRAVKNVPSVGIVTLAPENIEPMPRQYISALRRPTRSPKLPQNTDPIPIPNKVTPTVKTKHGQLNYETL